MFKSSLRSDDGVELTINVLKKQGNQNMDDPIDHTETPEEHEKDKEMKNKLKTRQNDMDKAIRDF